MPREFDSPWKDTLDEYLESVMALFHPVLHEDIAWSLGYQKLDAELSEIVRDAELGQTVADRLFRVTLKDGRSVQLLIHIEVQTQYDADLARRMYVYQYRLFDCYNDDIEAIAILGDDRPN